MDTELVSRSVTLPGGELRLLQPDVGAELPDDGGVEWAPIAPYWAVLWRSGVALAQEVADADVAGLRVVELGCGLALPSIVAARVGAQAIATDAHEEALELAHRNAELNGAQIETAVVDWREPEALLECGPFDLALAADVLYERGAVGRLLELLPNLAPDAWVADPGRTPADVFIDRARERWDVESVDRGVVSVHRIEFGL